MTGIGNRQRARASAWLVCLVCAATVLAIACAPLHGAWAYYALAPVDIGLSSTSITLEVGQNATVGCSVSPASEAQLPGCGMAECPQGCGDLTTPDGVVGGCQNEEGWCTCSGLTYVTYNTKVTLMTSAPNVARARYEGGALVVKAYGVGTAAIQVKAALEKHVASSETLTVTVTEPPAPQEEQAASTGADAGKDSSAGTSAGNPSGSSSGSGNTASSDSAGETGSTGASKPSSAKSGGSEKSGSSAKAASSSTGVTVGAAGFQAATGAPAVQVKAVGAGDDGDAGAADPDAADAEAADPADAEAAIASSLAPAAPVDASAAAASVSVAEPASPGAAAGGAAVLTGALAVALVAGAFRYRSWKRQHGPLSEE